MVRRSLQSDLVRLLPEIQNALERGGWVISLKLNDSIRLLPVYTKGFSFSQPTSKAPLSYSCELKAYN